MRSWWLALILLLGGALLLGERVCLDARLIPIKGSTTVQRSETGTVVATGPNDRIALQFQDGTLVKLDGNSALEIPDAARQVAEAPRRLPERRVVLVASAALDALPGGTARPVAQVDPLGVVLADTPPRLKLLRGQMWGHFLTERAVTVETRPQEEGAAARAQTRESGTVFSLGVAEDGTATVRVEEKSVVFSNAHGKVVVHELQESVARPGRAPTPPVTVNLPVALEWTSDVLPQPPLEVCFISQEPHVLEAARREAEALPPGPERWRRLGDVHHDRGEWSDALTAYRRALVALEKKEGTPTVRRQETPSVLLAAATPEADARGALHARIGLTLLRLDQFSEAEAELRRSLADDPGAGMARAGLATLLLARGDTEAAWLEARAGVAAPAGGATEIATVHLALGVVELERGRIEAAEAALKRALATDPRHAQVHAWHSVLLRSRNDPDGALAAARRAVELAPRSATCHQVLADAYLLMGARPGERRKAREHARQAVALNPLSASARVSLANAELLNGRVELAAREARQGAALNPRSDRAHYTLGAALAAQRRYSMAQRHLEQAVNLNEGLLDARTLLGRVLTRQGRLSEASAVVRKTLARDPDHSPARALLGQIYRLRGDLREAARLYEEALERSPRNGLYHLEVARIYLDLNDLPAALAHAQEAVFLLPDSSEARTALGLVYDRQNNRAQALQEYRTALQLSAENALARLGLSTSFAPGAFGAFESGQERLRERAQALLRDPSTLQEVWKPGVLVEGALRFGSNDGQRALHRGQFSDGRVHDLTVLSRFSDDGDRKNSEGRGRALQTDVAVQATPTTQVLFQFLEERLNGGLPGSLDEPDRDAFARRRRMDAGLYARQTLGSRTHLWLGYGSRAVRNERSNPDGRPAPLAGSPWPGLSLYESDHRRDEDVVELRLDHRLGRHRLTYGFAHVREKVRLFIHRYAPEEGRRVTVLEEEGTLRARDQVHYIQDDYRFSKRGTLIAGAQLRRASDQPIQELRSRVLLPPDQPRVRVSGREETSDHFLPYLALAYNLGDSDLVRLWGNRNLLRFGGPRLAPAEAFLAGDPLNLFFNGRVESYGLEYERRFSPGTFMKGFLQHGLARNFLVQPGLDESFEGRGLLVPKARARVAGLRLEQQLNRNLSAFTDWRYQEVTDRTDNAYLLLSTQAPGQNFARGLQVPLVPRWRGLAGLNYVDSTGTKWRLVADLLGPRFTDVGVPGSNGFGTPTFDPNARRSREGSRVFLDLQIGKEPSVGLEYSLTITNLLNTRSLDWPGYPSRERRFFFSITRRY